MTNKRRLIIIISSVLSGTLISFLLVRRQLGKLDSHAWFQLALNFFFALAIVIVIGIVLRKKGDKM